MVGRLQITCAVGIDDIPPREFRDEVRDEKDNREREILYI